MIEALEKLYWKRNDLVCRRWSGKQKAVVSGINFPNVEKNSKKLIEAAKKGGDEEINRMLK